MAHDLARTGSGNGTRRYEGNQSHFNVEIIPHRGGNLARIRKHLGVFHFGNDGQSRLAVFMNLERGHAIAPDQSRRSLHNVLDILRVIVLPAENNHVLDAAANKELAVVEEAHVAGAQVAIVIGAVVYQARAKLLLRHFRVFPVAQALAASGDPYFADEAILESDVPLRIHDLDIETREAEFRN